MPDVQAIPETESRAAGCPETVCCPDGGEEGGTNARSSPSCPMAAMCRGAVGKPDSAFVLFIPAVLLVVIGIAIIVQPKILLWLVAAILILLGVGIAFMASGLHRMARRFQPKQGA